MPPRLACIVEGQGDVVSIPVIVRRVAEVAGVPFVDVRLPFRIARSRAVRTGEIERAVELSARSPELPTGVLVVLDADDDLPCELGPVLLERLRVARADIASAVVIATREKEAWFIAAIESLRGLRDIPENAVAPDDPERIRGAKEWIGRLMRRSYSEITDQPALAARFDLGLARARSASFDKLWRAVHGLVRDADHDKRQR
jgi:hypothetical protein